jgi:hypothetical protein
MKQDDVDLVLARCATDLVLRSRFLALALAEAQAA